MFRKRHLRLWSLTPFFLWTLAACASSLPPDVGAPQGPRVSPAATVSAATAPVAAPATAWTGTITMFAQDYTPGVRKSNTRLTAFRRIADEYERMHPGIRIVFVDQDVEGYNDDTIRVKASSGELSDIFWAQWQSLNSTLPPGIALDLAPYFDQPNPYIPNTETWQQAMNQTVVEQTVAPNGAHYNINGDYVATAFFYNVSLFQKAGITAPPKTWRELLDVSKKLKAVGVPASIGIPLYSWWSRHFLSDFYAKDYDRIAGFDKLPGISALDEAVAIRKGLFSTNDPRFLAWWPNFKEFTATWVPEYLTQPPENADAAFQDFVAGKAAMYYSGSWLPYDLRAAKANFAYSAFNFPVLGTEVSPFSTGVDVSNVVGGPNAAYQYAVSTPAANASMKEAGKVDAVLDWLRYIGTPRVIQEVVDEKDSYIPTWPNTRARPGAELLVSQANQPLRSVTSTNTSPQLDADLQRVFAQYLAGLISLEQAGPQVQLALDRAVQDYAARNNVNLDDY